MKKVLVVFLMLNVIVLLTGCGNKKELVCSTSSAGVTASFNMKYNSNKFESFKISYNIDLSKFTDEKASQYKNAKLCSTIAASMSWGSAFTGCNQKLLENNKISVNTNVDISKISDNDLDELNDIEKAKKSFESKGFECKIK